MTNLYITLVSIQVHSKMHGPYNIKSECELFAWWLFLLFESQKYLLSRRASLF
jgi:hypothetical protein